MREPYPNELYHYGVKGMKWGKRKVRPQTGNHPTTSGSLHKVGEGLGLSAHPFYSRSTSEQVYLRKVQKYMDEFRKNNQIVENIRRKKIDTSNSSEVRAELLNALRNMEQAYTNITSGLSLVTNVSFSDGYNTMMGSRIAELAKKTLPSYETALREARNAIAALSIGKPMRKVVSKRSMKKRGRIAAEGILDGQFKNGTGGWNTSLDKGAR